MVMQRLLIACLLFVGFGVLNSVAQVKQCLDKKTICQSFETCVTWERGCSVGANCLRPGHHESFTECVSTSIIKKSILPSKELCSPDEVFARSIDKSCQRPSLCPLRLGYNCYPTSGMKPTCLGVRCPFGTFCQIGESCSDLLCKPEAKCKILT